MYKVIKEIESKQGNREQTLLSMLPNIDMLADEIKKIIQENEQKSAYNTFSYIDDKTERIIIEKA